MSVVCSASVILIAGNESFVYANELSSRRGEVWQDMTVSPAHREVTKHGIHPVSELSSLQLSSQVCHLARVLSESLASWYPGKLANFAPIIFFCVS